MSALASPAQVLVVDDEPDLRTLYELTLLREGYRVDAAGTVAEAWQQLQAKRFDPDGAYVRAWVPELGTPDYPPPIVDLAQAREDALAAYARR